MQQNLTFVTGNLNKLDFASKFLGVPIDHHNLDLEELQDLDLKKVVEHKARQSYDLLHKPVLVEDCSLEYIAMGRLPGTFVRWFEAEMGLEKMCRLLDSYTDRRAIARISYAYFDGKKVHYFDGEMKGRIASEPAGTGGISWDSILILDGHEVTRSELDAKTWAETSYRTPALAKLRDFLQSGS